MPRHGAVRLSVPGEDHMEEESEKARALAAALEPVAGQVYFSPECHTGYAALGFGASPGDFAGVAAPDGAAYFCSRGSVMGQVPGSLVAAAFGVFNPAVVVPLVTAGWQITDAATICAARDDGGVGQLRRILGEHPDGVERADALLARGRGAPAPGGKASLLRAVVAAAAGDPARGCLAARRHVAGVPR
jgi:hypothetical protein